MTRVLVVDDHPVFRAGLVALLSSVGYEVVGEAASSAEATALADRLQPDLVLMDLGLPDGSGVEATGRIVGARPATRVVVVTMFDDDGSVREALRAGACGYVVKDAAPVQLLAIVRAAEEGAMVLGPGAGRIDGILAEEPARDLGLTSREREVADLLARGLPNRVIAERLGLSGKTIANHVSTILAKLGAADRFEAARIIRAALRP